MTTHRKRLLYNHIIFIRLFISSQNIFRKPGSLFIVDILTLDAFNCVYHFSALLLKVLNWMHMEKEHNKCFSQCRPKLYQASLNRYKFIKILFVYCFFNRIIFLGNNKMIIKLRKKKINYKMCCEKLIWKECFEFNLKCPVFLFF